MNSPTVAQPLRPTRHAASLSAILTGPGCTIIAGSNTVARADASVALLTAPPSAPFSNRVPTILRDVIVDPIQITEARSLGFDAVCLRASLLKPGELERLVDHTRALGMVPIPEVAHRGELRRAMRLQPEILGFGTPQTLSGMSFTLPAHIARIAVGAVTTPADVVDLAARGADAVLTFSPRITGLVAAGLHPACPSR